MRIYQSGAEGGAYGYEATGGGSVGVSSDVKTGGGNYSYMIGSLYFGKIGKIDSGVAKTLTLPNTANLSKYYYKSDMYIDSLSAVGNGLSVFAFNSGGATDQVTVLIYNDGGTLKMVNQYNTNNYWYDSGTAHSSVVDLGVAFDTWFRLEVHVDASTTAGSHVCQVKINGVTVINDTNITFTSTTTSNMSFGATNLTGTDDLDVIAYVDNISVNDATGLFNNSWVGEEYIVALRPSDFGDDLGGTSSIAGVSEIPVTTTANGVGSSSNIILNTNTAVSMTLTDPVTGVGTYTNGGGLGGTMPSDAAVKAVSVPVYIRESAAGTSSYRTYLRSGTGGTRYNTATVDAGNTTVRTSPNDTTNFGNLLISETDPTTGGVWKVTGTNSLTNMQIGVERVSGATDLWIPAMNAMVAYGPYTAPENHGMLIMFW